MSGAPEPAEEPMKRHKHFKRLLSCERLQMTGRLPQQLLIGSHFKKEAITSSPLGRGERGRWGAMWLSTVGRPLPVGLSRRPLRAAHDLLSLGLRCPFISRRDVKGVTDEERTSYFLSLMPSQPTHALTVVFESSMFPFCCHPECGWVIADPVKENYFLKVVIRNQPQNVTYYH